MEITRLEVQSDDVLVLTTDQCFDRDTIGWLKVSMTSQLKDAGLANKVIVLTAGLKLDVVRKAA